MKKAQNTNPFQFESLIDFMLAFKDDKTCKDHLKGLRWKGETACVFCGSTDVYTRKSGHNHECRECGKAFTTTSNTIFADSKIGMQKWYIAMYLLFSCKKGISSVNLASKIGVTQKTAWFMLHRVRYAFENKSFEAPKDGIYQADETYIGGKDSWKHADKKSGKRGRGTDKTPVFGIRNQDGRVHAQVVPNVKGITLKPIIAMIAKKDSVVMTDEWKAYNGLKRNYTHKVVAHKEREYVAADGATVNGMENYWMHLKGMIRGTHHYISPKHTQRYVDAQSFRYNERGAKDWELMEMGIGQSHGKRLTYRQLIQA